MRERLLASLKRLWQSQKITTDNELALILADLTKKELEYIKNV